MTRGACLPARNDLRFKSVDGYVASMSTVAQLIEEVQKLEPDDQLTFLRSLSQSKAIRGVQIEALRQEIEIGIRQADSGLTKPFDAADLKRRLDEQLSASEKSS